MRKTLVGLLAACLCAAGPAFAESEVERELAEMRELVEGLKQKVDAQEEQLRYQGNRLEDAHEAVRETRVAEGADDAALLSGVGEFWQAIDVGISAAGSYAMNFRDPTPVPTAPNPGAGVNNGTSGLFYPFHGDSNSFQVDQVWLDIGKAPTEESRAGFMFTLLFGNTASFLGQGGNLGGASTSVPVDIDGDGVPELTGGSSVSLSSAQGRRAFNDSTSDYYVHQAYVSWLAPVGEGVQFDFGKFATLVGAEVADATQNFNVTRGNIYNLFQPIDHVGLLASTTAGPLSLAAGVVNEGSLLGSSPDVNQEKAYIGQIGFGLGDVSNAVTVIYGADGSSNGGRNGPDTGIVDLVSSIEVGSFEGWLNADYVWVEGTSAQAWGVAVAGRVPLVPDLLTAALRLEYAVDERNFFGILGTRHSDIYGATGTLGLALAENLTLNTEVRWDHVVEEAGAAEEFLSGRSTKEEQVVGLAQVVFGF